MKYLFWTLWKSWFYLLGFCSIVLLSPFLIVGLSSEKLYPMFFFLARIWAKIMFYGMGFSYLVTNNQTLDKNQSYIFIANHTSMLDVMLMLIIFKNPFVFIGKKELASLPLFGFFYKRAAILVDRSSTRSRQKSLQLAQEKLKNGRSICIFPEGGVPEDSSIVLDSFKSGAFRLAIEFQTPIVALSINQLKESFPFVFFGGKPQKINVFMHPIIETPGLKNTDKECLKNKCRNLILSKLLN